jgi:hypothetical protein
LKPDGIVLINTEKTVDDLKLKPKVCHIGRELLPTAVPSCILFLNLCRHKRRLLPGLQFICSKQILVIWPENARVVEESFRAFQKEVA